MVKIGILQMTEFQRNLPEGFHEKLSSKVVIMLNRKKSKNFEPIKTFNTDLIFSYVVYMASTDHHEFSAFYNYEFAPVPVSLFKRYWTCKININKIYTSKKSVLKNKLKVEVLSRKLKDDVQVGDLMVVEYYTPQYNDYKVY